MVPTAFCMGGKLICWGGRGLELNEKLRSARNLLCGLTLSPV